MSSIVKVKKIKDEKKYETKNIDIEEEPEKVIKKVKKIKEPIPDTTFVEQEIEQEIEQKPEKPKKSKKIKEVKEKEIIQDLSEDDEKGGYDANEKRTEDKLKTKGKIKKTKETGKKDKEKIKDKVIKEEIAASNEIYKGLQVLIVESPNKIKKITDLLDKLKKIPNFEKCSFLVTASMGHIREIDKTRVGIDINNNFEPCYMISESKIHVVHDLKDAISDAKMVWLAADADREGEAIAWHLMDVLKLKETDYNRITFNEITEKALKDALLHPRKIDFNMYYSQKARSVIDKLIGYLISPVLDAQFQTFGLSAGRVQSVAVKLVAEREKEIEKFESSGYYQIKGLFNPQKQSIKSLIIPADLDKTFIDKEKATEFLELGNVAEYKIIDISTSQTKRRPPPPLITSSLQQEASIKLGISPDETMRIAQKLYENGFITYMRTDSVMLSEDAKKDIAGEVNKYFGEGFHQNNTFANKDDAQAAHEACRPCDFSKKSLLEQGGITPRENKVYDLIWKRSMASQMAPAEVEIKTVKIGMNNAKNIFISKAEKITYKGFLALYEKEKHSSYDDIENIEGNSKSKSKKTKKEQENQDAEGEGDDDNEVDESGDNSNEELYDMLNKLEKGDLLNYKILEGTEKFSKPPHGRYTEASLIKELERLKIGRPSTYSSIITKIQDVKRNYVKKMDKKGEKKDVHILQYLKKSSKDEGKFTVKTTSITTGAAKQKLFALDTGKTIVEFLNENFEKIMNYSFTANVEEQLDDIALGKFVWHEVIKGTYDCFQPQIEIIRGKHKEGHKGKIKRFLGIDPVSNCDVSIIFTKKGPTIYMEVKEEKKYCNINDEEVMEMTFERALELLKYPIILKSPSNDEKETLQICKGKSNYYIKSSQGSVPLSQEEPKNITYEIAKQVFDTNFITKESKTLRVIDKDIEILKGPYGAYICYKKKLNVAIPKKYEYETITRDEAATLINKKTQDKKNGVKPKVFKKWAK